MLPLFLLFTSSFKSQQIANYVNNGSFEDLYSCNPPPGYAPVVKYWSSIDTTKNGFVTNHVCLGTIPYVGAAGFQWPRTGNGLVRGTLLCDINTCSPIINRSYFRNKLKSNLKPNAIYCVKFYVNIINPAPYGIDGFGVYFIENSIDTTNYPYRPLITVTPQIQNPIGNIITDTLNWTAVTGTFMATGTEKYMIIGNFKTDANTMKTQIQPTVTYAWCDVNLDDASCIDIDLPAYAGPDVAFVPGGSVYIGRPQDVGIDEACMWYKLPNTTTAIDTAAGIWVSPATTSTYIVKQEICGNIKWDTVVVHQSAVGLAELEMLNDKLKISPNPVTEMLNVEWEMMNEEAIKNNWRVEIVNALGQVVNKDELVLRNNKASIYLTDLSNGVYLLNLKGNHSQTISKRFVIAK